MGIALVLDFKRIARFTRELGLTCCIGNAPNAESYWGQPQYRENQSVISIGPFTELRQIMNDHTDYWRKLTSRWARGRRLGLLHRLRRTGDIEARKLERWFIPTSERPVAQ